MSIAEEIELHSANAVESRIIEQTDDFNEIQPTSELKIMQQRDDFNEMYSTFAPKSIGQTNDSNEIYPTAEELSTLERVADKIPMAAWLIVICELCERFAFYGISGLFQNYIEFPLPSGNDTQPGALDKGQQTATALTMFFRFFAYLTPIIGAILADQLWGKYKTIMVSCVVYMVGLIILLLTSIPPAIDAGIAFPGLIVAIIILGFGTGGVKSNVSPLMAEQYTRTKPTITVIKGKRQILDPDITMQSMFNWFYWAINIGALSLILTTNIEKYHSFWLAYLIPTVAFVGAIVVLIIGRNQYVQKPPAGSLLIRSARVTMTAIRMRWRMGKQADRPTLLDYAKTIPPPTDYNRLETGTETNNNQFIDDLKKAVRACRVFAFYPLYWICYNQFGTNLVSQAAQMNVGPLPNDILQNIDPLVLIILIPLFDKVIYPGLRRCKINFSAIARIACGFLCVSLGMGWSAFVQHLIYTSEPNGDFVPKPEPHEQQYNNITVAWQIPAYFFIALSEIFGSITGLEYAFTQAPPSMKSIVMSLFLFTSAIGSAINIALVPVSVNPKILWMYVALAGESFVTGIVFYFVFRNDQRKVHVEEISTK
ncbi:unnamed protein product [Adineta steineri]|uniref:Uncharacterized protein n=1 Tax=Adineta steineri TaxID=433720 RepID=A0A814VYE7_9BILA|nr:unnamed protein product [Adineta steineri]CAF1451929.1 unnamed protein product [Adineta steineri]